ncbi:uncharacterized protein [Oscarella lobularis]|uniref:uncharacterized protein isoform X2 n=1 Tax=Oscarella lobularis TaxID=121494 RepID=UPI0033135C24
MTQKLLFYFLAMSFFTVLGGWIADAIRNRSTRCTRNLMNSIGMFSSAVFFVLLNNIANRAHAILICSCSAAAIYRHCSPYAGFLAGFANVAGTMTNILALYTARAMASGPSGSQILKLQWENVF